MRHNLLKTIAKGMSTVLLCGMAASFAAGCGQEEYRTISVDYLNGTSMVSRKNTSDPAYEGMHLYSGDTVEVQPDSDMTLLVDLDKYLYAPENTKFSIEASGDNDCGVTRITLEDGSVLTRIDNKLREGEEFSVVTPRSVMSVRGTVFRIAVSKNEKGETVANTQVYQGAVQVDLHDKSGKPTGKTVTFEAGTQGTVISNSETAEKDNYEFFLKDQNNAISQPIDFTELPKDTAVQMVLYMDAGEELCISRDELMEVQNITEADVTAKKEAQKKAAAEAEAAQKEEKQPAVKALKQTVAADSDSSASSTAEKDADSSEAKPQADHSSAAEAPKEQDKNQPADSSASSSSDKDSSLHGDSDKPEKDPSDDKDPVPPQKDPAEVTPPAVHTNAHKTEIRVIKEPTCTQTGTEAVYCTVCKKNIETRSIPATGHCYVKSTTESVAPTCGTVGASVSVCKYCGDKKRIRIPATGDHDYRLNETTKPTCREDGHWTYVCSHCKTTKTETIPATGQHFFQTSSYKAPTCGEDGYRIWVCKQCGTRTTETIPATGKHQPGAWETVTEPTCCTEGSRIQKCTVCGQIIRQETIPADPSKHNMSAEARHYRVSDDAFVPYEYTTTAMYYGRYCTNPGCTYKEGRGGTIHYVTKQYNGSKSVWDCVCCNPRYPSDLN